MAPDLHVDFGSRTDLFHGESVKVAQRAAKDRMSFEVGFNSRSELDVKGRMPAPTSHIKN